MTETQLALSQFSLLLILYFNVDNQKPHYHKLSTERVGVF